MPKSRVNHSEKTSINTRLYRVVWSVAIQVIIYVFHFMVAWRIRILRYHLTLLFGKRTKHLFKTGNWDEIRESITSQLKEDGFFTCYDVLDPDRKPEDIMVDDAKGYKS